MGRAATMEVSIEERGISGAAGSVLPKPSHSALGLQRLGRMPGSTGVSFVAQKAQQRARSRGSRSTGSHTMTNTPR